MQKSILGCVVGVALAAGIAAGCGGSSPAASSGGSDLNARAERVLVQLAACIRAHGLPSFPGPVVGDNGVPKFPDSAPRVPASARTACASVASRLPPQYTETQPVSSADLHKLIAFARCMRRTIPDWPDPNALGEFAINSRIQHGGKRLFVPAAHACARLNPDPSGGINVIQARS